MKSKLLSPGLRIVITIEQVMNRTSTRWLKLLAWVLGIMLLIVVVIPTELTDEQLSRVNPGMTIQDVEQMLGNPCRSAIVGSITWGNRPDWVNSWYLEGAWHKPALTAAIPDETILLGDPNQTWVGKKHLLWVEHSNGTITRTWLFPITRTGGGIQGCVETLKNYWNQWWSK